MSYQHPPTFSKSLKSNFPSALSVLAVATFCAAMSSMAVAADLPTGGDVTHGLASINSSGNTMNVTQTSANAVIGWNSFDVAQGHSVNFQVPVGGATLNQISGSASQINGKLNSNGALFLINPNGVMFGGGANVNVGSLVATTNKLNSNDFMKGGDLAFSSGGNGVIKNHGKISTSGKQGYVVLAGSKDVENHGSITAAGGTIHMIGADKFTLTLPTQNPFLTVSVDPTGNGYTHMSNYGQLKAGAVTMHTRGRLYSYGNITATGLGDLSTVNLYARMHKDLNPLSGAGGDGDVRIEADSVIRADGGLKINAAQYIRLNGTVTASSVDAKSSGSVDMQDATILAKSGNIDISAQRMLRAQGGTLSARKGEVKLKGEKGGQLEFAPGHHEATSIAGSVNIADAMIVDKNGMKFFD